MVSQGPETSDNRDLDPLPSGAVGALTFRWRQEMQKVSQDNFVQLVGALKHETKQDDYDLAPLPSGLYVALILIAVTLARMLMNS